MTIKAKWTQASVTPDPTPTTPSTSGSSRRKSGTSISLGSSTNIDGRFADVSSGDWFASGVKYVLDNNIMNGVSANTFEPNGNLTRGMFVTMLYRADGRTDVIKSVFDDVADSAYYANAVGWAAANGIVLGVSDTMYAPDDNITREQMAAIMYRYFEYKGRAGVAKRANMAAYADADSISEYAKNAVSWACAKNIISGKASGIIAPNDYATRAEAATILMRLANSVN